MSEKVILGIESSCDETAIGIVQNSKVLYEQVYSSANLHAKYGGVIPELASRKHEEHFVLLLQNLKQNFDLSKITDIVYTAEPGLIGGLNVAKVFANMLAWQLNINATGINHLYGHAFSAGINQEPVTYPFLSLVVSGKTTSIYLITSSTEIKELTHTTDDAAGETLDKLGRELQIPYPAGKVIDESYKDEDAIVTFSQHTPRTHDFSFSGFKTSVLNVIKKNQIDHKYTKNQILSSALKWVLRELLNKLEYYAEQYHINTVYIGGGVSASKTLQKLLMQQPWIKTLHLTAPKYTGDNGVMIAFYGEQLLNEKK